MYNLIFMRHDGKTEMAEFVKPSDAWEAFRMFAEARSSDAYAHISIREGDKALAVMVFLEEVV